VTEGTGVTIKKKKRLSISEVSKKGKGMRRQRDDPEEGRAHTPSLRKYSSGLRGGTMEGRGEKDSEFHWWRRIAFHPATSAAPCRKGGKGGCGINKGEDA